MTCELITTCPFFNDRMGIKPQTAAIFKARYCRGEFAECARYLVFVSRGREAVPSDLSPNDRLRALRMLREEGGPGSDSGPRLARLTQ